MQKFNVLALTCGLALCNQHTIIVYVVMIALWTVVRLYRVKVSTIDGQTDRLICLLIEWFIDFPVGFVTAFNGLPVN